MRGAGRERGQFNHVLINTLAILQMEDTHYFYAFMFSTIAFFSILYCAIRYKVFTFFGTVEIYRKRFDHKKVEILQSQDETDKKIR